MSTKLVPALTADVVVTPDALPPIPLITPYIDMVRRAIEAHAGDGIDFYDVLIVAAAERAGAAKIWSEA